jgi:hypothetical protein
VECSLKIRSRPPGSKIVRQPSSSHRRPDTVARPRGRGE